MNRLPRCSGSVILVGLLGLALGSSSAVAGGRRLVFEDTIIQGKVQKPEITIFISKQNLDTDYNLELKESFIPKIVETVDKKPF